MNEDKECLNCIELKKKLVKRDYKISQYLDKIESLEEKDKSGEIGFVDELERYADGVNYYIETH